MPSWSRLRLFASILLVYALVVIQPAVPIQRVPKALRSRVDARWPAQPLRLDARALELGGASVMLVLAVLCVGLVRLRRRVTRRDMQLAQAEALHGQHARLRERWNDWVESRYPLAFRCDTSGLPIELEDRSDAFPDLEPSRFIGRSFEDGLDPQDRAGLRHWVERALVGTPDREPVVVLARSFEHEARWLELMLRLEPDPEVGTAIEGIGRDVSARRQEDLEREARGAIERECLSSGSVETSLERVLRTLAEGLRCQYGELWWLDERYEVLTAGECWCAPGAEVESFARESRSRTFGKGVGLAGRVWADDRVVRIHDLASEVDPRCARLAETGSFRSALGFPVRIGERVAGVVVLLSHWRLMAPAEPEVLDRLGAALGRLVDRKRRDRALLGSEARKNAMLESALDCVISVDEQGRIVEFNPSAEKTFGHSRAQVLGESMVSLLVPEDLRGQHSEAFQRCLGPASSRPAARRIETEALRADGSRFPVEISVTSIHVGERPSFTAYLRDITERKELDRLKDELVSTVSHELRTPLASMRGFVELLLARDFSAAEQHRFLEIVDKEMRRLGRLIDDFLDLQRLESGGLEYAFQAQPLRPLLEEAVEMFRHTSDRHIYHLEVAANSMRVRADADRLRQALRNLLSNATKYSPDGGRVTVLAAKESGLARVAVRDEGIGMDAQTKEKLFTRFFRADSTATRRIGGTGLGLALVREIVEAHGGEVGVTSSPGEGSEFHFSLPLVEGATE